MKHLRLYDNYIPVKPGKAKTSMKSIAKKLGYAYKNLTNEYDFELDEFISISKITDTFSKYGLACDNKSYLTEIEINNNEFTIYCMYTSLAMDGSIPKNISEILDKICEELGADEWEFGQYHDTVTFSFDEEKIKAIDKYNI